MSRACSVTRAGPCGSSASAFPGGASALPPCGWRRAGASAHGRDFRPAIYSGAGEADGPLRPTGNACTAGALASIRPGDVAIAGPDGCLFRVKAANAARAGAAALLTRGPLAQ